MEEDSNNTFMGTIAGAAATTCNEATRTTLEGRTSTRRVERAKGALRLQRAEAESIM